ncbi:MAG TPA: HAD family phosphatase [Desulfobacterales bacterium]|nr:HAD family phosphatase [Desulfobacterales bacterium]
MALVLVDLDGTLLKGISSERLFFLELFRKKVLGIRQIFSFLGFSFRWFTRYGKNVWKKNKAYLAGLHHQTIKALATQFVQSELSKRICPEMKKRIEIHHRNGDETVLLSGTLDAIALPIASFLGIKHVCATKCSTIEARYSSAPPLIHPFGRDKLKIGFSLCRKLGYELSDCTAYGDSPDDIQLLESVSHPVAVHPKPRLRKIALRRSWEIIDS